MLTIQMNRVLTDDERKQAAEERRNQPRHIRELDRTLQEAVDALNRAMGQTVVFMPARDDSSVLYFVSEPEDNHNSKVNPKPTRTIS